MQMIGKDDPGVDMEWRTGAHLPNRVAQSVDSRHQQVRPPVKQVHCKEEGSCWNPIAAVVRHERSMPGLGERRNALPLFRPTLATSSARGCMRAAAHRRSPDGMASERASGQFVDQSRRGHSVTDDDQRLAHGMSLLGA